MKIWSYKMANKSAKALAEALDCKIIKHENSLFVGNKKTVVINWGASKVNDEVKKCQIINTPEAIKEVINKENLLTFLGHHFDVPVFTKDKDEAEKWIDAGCGVFHDDGVFTLKTNVTSTFRLHVINKQIITVQKKNGTNDVISAPTKDMINQAAIDVIKFLGLDFGAITVGWNNVSQRYYILNVNTAPELTSDLAIIYAKAFKK